MKRPCRAALSLLVFVITGWPSFLPAYGPLAHEIVGGIADERLVNTRTAATIHALLGGMTLEKASLIADEIKRWDQKGVDASRSYHLVADRKIDRELRDFWRANPPTPAINPGTPSHHWFHYTDVPVVPSQKYRDGKTGRSRWDIVHMIPYCVRVLQGRIPEQNERKITKSVALILLAHYVGDIHQPLHVGAEYFTPDGHVTDPDKDQSALTDEGGNAFTLELIDEPPRRRGIRKKKFHPFWDYDAVNTLFPQLAQTLPKKEMEMQIEPLKNELIHEMAMSEPRDWRMPANMPIDKYAEAWADEILPLAREAHERLQFTNVHPEFDGGRMVASGEAVEKRQLDQTTYRQWAASVVREELHKAGWRLADLLQKIL